MVETKETWIEELKWWEKELGVQEKLVNLDVSQSASCMCIKIFEPSLKREKSILH